MSKSLLSLKQRNDYQGRQIRCLIIEDPITGLLSKVREPKSFEKLIKDTPSSMLTIVFEPTEADRKKLLGLIAQNVDMSGDVPVSTIGEEDVLLTLLEMTDLDINPMELKENRALMTEILAQPSALFISIKNELDVIALEIVATFEEIASVYRQMPEELLNTSTRLLEMEKQKNENKKKIEAKKKEIESLEQQIADLEVDMGGNA